MVAGDVTLSSRVSVSGDVKLILADGAHLTAGKGICVSDGNSLTVYASKEGTLRGSLSLTRLPPFDLGVIDLTMENVSSITVTGREGVQTSLSAKNLLLGLDSTITLSGSGAEMSIRGGKLYIPFDAAVNVNEGGCLDLYGYSNDPASIHNYGTIVNRGNDGTEDGMDDGIFSAGTHEYGILYNCGTLEGNRPDCAMGEVTTTVTVHNGLLERGSATGKYVPGDPVTVTADEDPYSKYFLLWTGTEALSITEGDPSRPTMTFTMPDRDVTVTAVYGSHQTYSITVEGGKLAGGATEGDILAGDKVTVTADPPPAGHSFRVWEGTDYITFTRGDAATVTLYAQWLKEGAPTVLTVGDFAVIDTEGWNSTVQTAGNAQRGSVRQRHRHRHRRTAHCAGRRGQYPHGRQRRGHSGGPFPLRQAHGPAHRGQPDGGGQASLLLRPGNGDYYRTGQLHRHRGGRGDPRRRESGRGDHHCRRGAGPEHHSDPHRVQRRPAGRCRLQ